MKAFFALSLACLLSFVRVENPYRVIGMAPYHSIDDIKEQCKSLVRTYHPDKYKGSKEEARKKFDKIQKACKEIKESRGEDDETASGFSIALKKCVTSIIAAIVVIIAVYFFSKLLFKFWTYAMKFLIIYAIVYFVNDNFFSHYWETEEEQHGFTFVCAALLSSLGWAKNYFFPNSDIKVVEQGQAQ